MVSTGYLAAGEEWRSAATGSSLRLVVMSEKNQTLNYLYKYLWTLDFQEEFTFPGSSLNCHILNSTAPEVGIGLKFFICVFYFKVF